MKVSGNVEVRLCAAVDQPLDLPFDHFLVELHRIVREFLNGIPAAVFYCGGDLVSIKLLLGNLKFRIEGCMAIISGTPVIKNALAKTIQSRFQSTKGIGPIDIPAYRAIQRNTVRNSDPV